MQPTTTTIRLAPEILAQLNTIAEQMDRPRAWIIKEAITQYLDREAWFHAAVQKGLNDIQADRLIHHEEIGARLKAKGFNVDP